MNKGYWATVAMTAVGSEDLSTFAPGDYELLRMGEQMDELVGRCVENARHLAEKLNGYADNCKSSSITYGQTPLGYSTVEDLKTDAARFDQLRSIFPAFVHAITGKSCTNVQTVLAAAGVCPVHTAMKKLEHKHEYACGCAAR